MQKKQKTIVLNFLFLIILSSAVFLLFKKGVEVEASWWNDSWSYRKVLTINSAQVTGDLTNFPVLVSLTDTNLSGHAQEDGDDFIFIDSEGKKLSHEIESYASSTGVLVAWVKISALSSTADTDIYMYYGNAGVENQEDSENVWDDNYKGVWHMDEATSTDRIDSTSYNNNLTASGSVGVIDGKIGNTADFETSSEVQYLYKSEPTSLDIYGADQAITISAWIWRETASADIEIIAAKYNYGTNDRQYGLIVHSDDSIRMVTDDDGELGNPASIGATSVATGQWIYMIGTYDDSYLRSFYNGLVDTNGGNNPLSETGGIYNGNGDFTVGCWLDTNTAMRLWDGRIDELRVSSIARSEAWAETEYNNQNNPSLFFAEQDEEVGPGPVGYWSFDEGYGATAHDESAGGNDGTITGAVWKDESECVSGKCLWFDGVDLTDVVVDIQDNMEEFTACTWFNANSLTNEDSDPDISLLGKAWELNFDNSGIFKFWIPTSSAYPRVNSSNAIETNKWYHICGVYYGIGIYPKLFINGIDDSELSSIGSGTLSDDSAYTLRIGSAINNSYYENFNGHMDEVKIYPYARTAGQIKQDYNAGLSGVSSKSGVSASFGGSSDKWMSDGLVGYWKMDETATTSGAIDASGNSNDGTFYGNASTTGGKFGNGGVFDGDNDSINFGSGDSLDNLQERTICQWIKPDSLSSTIYLIGKDSGNGMIGWNLYLDGANVYYYQDYVTGNLIVNLNTSLTVDTWQHVCFFHDGEPNTDNMKFWKNGILANNITTGSSPSGSMTNDTSYNLMIGSSESNSYEYTGLMDELRIYNRALSKSEVRKLYEWSPGPVLHLKMDEKSGGTAYDSVASSSFAGGNDGTISGATWARGEYGGAIQVDSDSEEVYTTDVNGLKWEIGSISMWYKETGEIEDYGGFFCVGTVYTQFSLYRNNNDNVLTFYYDGVRADFSSLPSVFDGEWHHIQVNWDQSVTNLYLYIDGVYQGSETISGFDPSPATNNNFYIGRINQNATVHHSGGQIDDVRIYNYARTQKQILEDMNNGMANKSPVLHLSFNEGRGETVHDSSIYKNNGTAYVGTGGTQTATSSMWEKSGKVKGAMEFDGTDDWIRVDDSDSLDLTTEGTLSAWVYADTQNPALTILSKGDDVDGHNIPYTIGWDFTDSTRLRVLLGDNSTFQNILTEESVSLGEWHHFVAKWDNTNITLFLDGEQNTTVAQTVTPYVKTTALTVGALRTAPSHHFDGKIDEVKIWNYALNEDEIKEEYNSGGAIVMGGGDASANDDGTTVTGDSAKYCVPGDTSQCSPPVLELKMNEKTGSTAYDTSGNGNDGTLTNGPSWTRGKKGSGLSFDGVDDYVHYSLPEIDIVTIEAWVYSESSGDSEYPRIVDTSAFQFSFTRSTNNTLSFVSERDTTFGSWRTPDNSIVDNTWYHLVATYNEASVGNDPTLYINGISQSITEASTPVGNPVNNVGTSYIGDDLSFSRYWHGKIDNVKIYNYARTPAQIAWDYNKGKPIAYYKFDECSGSVIHDSSGNDNHGALNLGSTGVTATGTCASSSESFWYNGRTGKKKGSGSFDGGDDYVDLSQVDTFENATEFSIATWFYVYDINTGGTILSKWQASPTSDSSVSLNVFNNGTGILWGSVHEDDSEGSNYVDYISNTGLIENNTWYHLVMTFEAESSTGLRIYLNGEEDLNSPLSTSDISEVESNSMPVRIGSWYDDSYPFDGKIDDVRIYNYALTVEQVKNVYNDGAVSFR